MVDVPEELLNKIDSKLASYMELIDEYRQLALKYQLKEVEMSNLRLLNIAQERQIQELQEQIVQASVSR